MAWYFKALAALLTVNVAHSFVEQTDKILHKDCNGLESSIIYGSNNFVVEDIHRARNISVSDYLGKVLLVVNVASF